MAQKSKKQRRDAGSSAALVNQYRPIGPAVLLAALLCAPKHRVRRPVLRRQTA